MEDAKQTANQLAALNNVTLGKPTFVSEGASTLLSPTKGVTVPAPTPLPETPISPGEIEISLTVQVAYEITR